MEAIMRKRTYVYVQPGHFSVPQKLIEHCKSTTIFIFLSRNLSSYLSLLFIPCLILPKLNYLESLDNLSLSRSPRQCICSSFWRYFLPHLIYPSLYIYLPKLGNFRITSFQKLPMTDHLCLLP